MSRIGKLPIQLPHTVTATIDKRTLSVKGPKGEITFVIPAGISVDIEDRTILVKISNKEKQNSALHGFVRAHIDNIVRGVDVGWVKILTLSGVGYRATVDDGTLVLTVGFSHPVKVAAPPGIQFTLEEGKIKVHGVDKQLVGQMASDIRKIKPPEPYKGKGILYNGEHVRKKAGKSAKGIGPAIPGATK